MTNNPDEPCIPTAKVAGLILTDLTVKNSKSHHKLCIHVYVQFKAGMKGRFQSFIEFAFSVLLETRKSLLCTIKQNNNCFTKSIFRRILILYIRQK